jgi:hypothetical protein
MPKLSPEHARYVAIETIVGVVINSALSLGFTLLALGGRDVAPWWGPGGVAFDFIPQVFMITFATTLATTLLARQRLKAGAVAPLAAPDAGWLARAPANPLLRAVVFGLAVAVVLVPASLMALSASGATEISAPALIVLKVVYGAVLAAAIAPPIVRAALLPPR